MSFSVWVLYYTVYYDPTLIILLANIGEFILIPYAAILTRLGNVGKQPHYKSLIPSVHCPSTYTCPQL